MEIIDNLFLAREYLKQGKIIAYPTEAVFGLGCDAFNQEAVARLLTIKKRGVEKGFILLISHWDQLTPLITPLSEKNLEQVKNTWPGHVTWLFPKSPALPSWLSGKWDSIAIRMSAHPIARALSMDTPIISTSANLSGGEPLKSAEDVLENFSQSVDYLIKGDLGIELRPSAIYDVISGKKLR